MAVLRSFLDALLLPKRLPGDEGQVLDVAAELMADPQGLLRLTPEQARVVARHMTPTFLQAGTTFIREGDAQATDFMLLVISGEVTVESIVVSRTDPITVRVLGPGSLHGDASLLDGQPRSASCTASTDLMGAVLTRTRLERLMERHPHVCARLLVAMGSSLALRLRESTLTLKRYAQLTKLLQQEIDHLLPHK